METRNTEQTTDDSVCPAGRLTTRSANEIAYGHTTDEQIARRYAEEYMGKPATGQHAIHEEDVAALVPFILTAIQSARGADGRRLDWLLNLHDPYKPHTGGWPYPDTRGTYGPRFVGIVYFESCEGRGTHRRFKDRAEIDAAMTKEASQ
jgi:hypothetical protein